MSATDRARRGAWLVAAAVILAAVTACSPHDARAAAPAPTVHPPLSQAEAMAVVRHYDTAIDAALDATSQLPLEALEAGPVLATSLSGRLFATPDQPASQWRHAPAQEQVYIPPVATYPQWFMSDFAYADDEGRTEFSVFERAHPGAPWLKTERSLATAHALSAPFVRGGTVQEGSTGQVDLARGAVTDLKRYIETGTDRGALTDVMLAQNDAEYFWAHLAINSDWLSAAVSCTPDLESPLVTVRTRDGAVDAIGSMTCTYTYRARPGHTIRLDPSARTWGITTLSGLHGYRFDEEKEFVLSVTDAGHAALIGYSTGQVNERLLCGCG